MYKSAIFTAGLSVLNLSAFAGNSDEGKHRIPHYVNFQDNENNLRKQVLLGEQPIQIKGNVYAPDGQLIKDAEISFWHNDKSGRFHTKRFRGKMATKANGAYAFSSYKPGDYVTKDGHKLPSRAFLLVKAKGYKDQLSTLYFTHDSHCHIDTATYEQSGVLPRPTLPSTQKAAGEAIISYDVYLKK